MRIKWYTESNRGLYVHGVAVSLSTRVNCASVPVVPAATSTLVFELGELTFWETGYDRNGLVLHWSDRTFQSRLSGSYETTTNLLRRPIVNVEEVRNYLNQLRQMVNQVPGQNDEVTKIRKTADDIEVTLGNVTHLSERAKRLADAFDTLTKFENLTVQLDKLNSTVSNAVQSMGLQALVIAPDPPVTRYRVSGLADRHKR
ncbi:hypothetical protein AHF37_07655 [Paragonimus kellicotti]|nr:hypothetical protein AHF37_07655 [Paragonimus kellicotti]